MTLAWMPKHRGKPANLAALHKGFAQFAPKLQLEFYQVYPKQDLSACFSFG